MPLEREIRAIELQKETARPRFGRSEGWEWT
jgi:hypothetical protein